MNYDRFLDALIEQFEELQQLRDRVRKAEAKALNNQRSCSRRQKKRGGSLRRNNRPVRATGLSMVERPAT